MRCFLHSYATGFQEALRNALAPGKPSQQKDLEFEEEEEDDDDEVDEDAADDDDDDENEEIVDGFRRKARLPESVFVRRNIAQLMSMPCLIVISSMSEANDHLALLDGDYLDVNPSYQRDVVWPSEFTL